MQRYNLHIKLQNAKTISQPTNTEFKDNISNANTKCKDTISPYKYKMHRPYLTLQIQHTKTIYYHTITKYKENISKYGYRM